MESNAVAVSEDYHTCGSCKSTFGSINDFLAHKKACSASPVKSVSKAVALTSSSVASGTVTEQNEATSIEVLVIRTATTAAPSATTATSANDLGQGGLACDICNKTFKSAQTLKAHRLIHDDSRPFVCPYAMCNYSFKTKGSLVRHERRHTDDRPFQCNRCQRRFRESGALTRHLKSQTPCTQKLDTDLPNYGRKLRLPGDAPRDEPGEPITTDLFAEQPLLDLQRAVGMEIPAVGMDEQSVSGLHPAITANTGLIDDDIATSSASDQLTVTAVTGASHESARSEPAAAGSGQGTRKETLTRADVFTKCLLCEEVIPDTAELRVHLKSHLTRGGFMCDLCTFVTHSRSELTSHCTHAHSNPRDENSQFMEEQNESDPCKLIGVERTNPKQTVRDATTVLQQLLVLDNSPYDAAGLDQADSLPKLNMKSIRKCPLCDRVFRSNSYLKLHMRRHTGERPYKCKQCPKDFPTKDTFKKHMLSHTDERQYKCGECGKLFKRVSHAKEHLKVHTNERPFYCVDCRKYFRSSNSYKVHLRTHTDQLPWVCKICERRFREKASLTRHIRIHTGEKPFSCRHCGKTFSEHGTLNRHYRAKVPCSTSLAEERERSLHALRRRGGMSAVEESLIPMEDGSLTGSATVLAEFSSVVTDTQEYMSPQAVDNAAAASIIPVSEGETIADESIHDSHMDTIEVIQEDGSVYIVRGSQLRLNAADSHMVPSSIIEGEGQTHAGFEDQSAQYILLNPTSSQLQTLEDNP